MEESEKTQDELTETNSSNTAKITNNGNEEKIKDENLPIEKNSQINELKKKNIDIK